jgi:hypothetical protein
VFTVSAFLSLWAKSMPPIRLYLWTGLSLDLIITVAALVHLDRSDFAKRPGGILYIGAYVATFVVASLILATSSAQRLGRGN